MVGYGTTPPRSRRPNGRGCLTNTTAVGPRAPPAPTPTTTPPTSRRCTAPPTPAAATPPVDRRSTRRPRSQDHRRDPGHRRRPARSSARTCAPPGVVTASYPTGGLNGFYLQTGGTGSGADATPDASDGIFVYGGTAGFTSYPAVGDSVQVVGTVSEFGGSTQITSTSANVTAVTPALAPGDAPDHRPRHRLRLPGTDAPPARRSTPHARSTRASCSGPPPTTR